FTVDVKTLQVIPRFALQNANLELLQRAITHASYRVAKQLPPYFDHRTLSVMGAAVAQACVAACFVRRWFGSEKVRSTDNNFAIFQASVLSAKSLEPFVSASGLLKFVRMGPQTSINELSTNQCVS